MLKFFKKYWKEVIFFGIITGYFLYGLSPDMTWMSIGADQGSYVVAALHNAPAGLSGNPLYILLGSLLLKLPGNPFWLLGLLSAIPVALTCIVVYLIVKKYTVNKIAPYIASLIFATSFVVWAESVIAETYGITLLASSLVIYFCLNKRYFWMAGVMALTLGLHPLAMFITLPCLAYTVYVERKSKLFWQIVGITAIGLVFRLRDFFTVSPTANTFFAQNPIQNILFSAGGYFSLPVIPLQPTLQRIGEDFAALSSSLWVLPFVIVILLTKKKEFVLLGVIAVLSFFFPFSSIYPQWIKYLLMPMLPIAILAGIGIDKLNLGKYTGALLIPCLIFGGLNVATYSPGKTIDGPVTSARQFYSTLDSLPDNALIIGHTWGMPDLCIYYYSVNSQDRIEYINYDTMVTGEFDMEAYRNAQKARGINYPAILDTITTRTIFVPMGPTIPNSNEVVIMGVTEFAQEIQKLNPTKEVYVTYVQSSAIPMVFGLLPVNEYRAWSNSIPASKVQFGGN